MLLRLTAPALLFTIVACAASSPPVDRSRTPATAAVVPSKKPLTPREQIERANQLFVSANYAEAERVALSFDCGQPAIPTSSSYDCVQLALEAGTVVANVQLHTGRYQEAAQGGMGLSRDGQVAGGLIAARALRAMGKLDGAQSLLQALDGPTAYEVWLLSGELLIARGRRSDAEVQLMRLIDAYNDDTLTLSGRDLSLVARAAHLLRSPEDANEAFNEAEQASPGDIPTLLWRARLFIDKYDSDHAEEVLSEVLAVAPKHPLALALKAQLHLDEALDFDGATELARQALAVNPHLSEAHAVLAGIALRDGRLEVCAEHLNRGLATNPHDLELLSMRAAMHLLVDDEAAFEQARQKVLDLNPQFSRFFEVVGHYAEWEHRYDQIVALMRQAIAIDDDDAKAHGELGLNLIRGGEEAAGLTALRRAAAKDPYNVRVYNTLELYEKVIATDYVTVQDGPFWFRYPKAELDILSRYVPGWIHDAWKRMREDYAFTPLEPIGVELYTERQHFSVRTSGLPRSAIQGVCFGKTLATMTARTEDFNQAMTLWHELAHVFHIQMSNNRVPRWFTEGLAEYETLLVRAEWKRERDPELYTAFVADRLPKIGAMNEAFTHAEADVDVTVAYYASTQIVAMLMERYGRAALNRMLLAWGRGLGTEAVIAEVLGTTSQQLDQEFAQYLRRRLHRFENQFVPDQRIGDSERIAARARAEPKDAEAQIEFAVLAMHSGQDAAALAALTQALKEQPTNPTALWLMARLALRHGEANQALDYTRRMRDGGHDGAAVQLVMAKALEKKGATAAVKEALLRATQFDPDEVDAWHGLLAWARQQGEQSLVQSVLQRLTQLEEHDADSAVQLMELHLAAGRPVDAAALGDLAIAAGVEHPEVHLLFGTALEQLGKPDQAEFEWLSATHCPSESPSVAVAHQRLHQLYRSQGRRREAQEHLERARALMVQMATPTPTP